ncbi:MAG: DUF721 domain-containing protein [Cyanobacteria bacterium]|nr:DUF721 domain-containing protein [Cyanobacteriota bacterium]
MNDDLDTAKIEAKRQEMERTLRRGLSKLDKILPRVLRQSGLERRLREHALFSLWPSVAGEVLAKRSRPLYVDLQSNIVITVSDSAVAQEITLARMQFLQKLAPLSRAAGVEIRGLRVDLKHYHHKDEPQPEEEHVTLPDPDEEELRSIELGPEQTLMLQQLQQDLLEQGKEADARQDSINKRVLMTYEIQLRLGVWRKSRGFPVCQACGFAVSRLHSREQLKVCFNCHVQSPEK